MAPRSKPIAADDSPVRAIRRVRTEKVSKAVAHLIVREVAEQGLPPGSALLPEQAMAEKYGVGRASIREALRMLEMGGIVSIRQGVGGGPVVVAPTGTEFAQLMTMYLQLSGARVEQLVDAVPLMEGIAAYGAAAGVAAGRVKKRDVERLIAIAEVPLTGHDNASFVDAGAEFHLAVRQMLDNQVLDLLISGVGRLFAQRAIRSGALLPSRKHAGAVTVAHQEIAAAIAAGDPLDAMTRMIQHQREEVRAVVATDPAVARELLDWR